MVGLGRSSTAMAPLPLKIAAFKFLLFLGALVPADHEELLAGAI
jgi:hypothetical protein